MKIVEKELIGRLKELSQIKPSKDWVVLTKSQILGKEKIDLTPFSPFSFSPFSVIRFLFQPKLAYISLVFVFVLFGLFGFAQNSLPGDLLYPIKRITERSQAVFVSETNKPQASLELADKRLEELAKVAETNQVKKLAPAINEFQASLSEAAKSLSKMAATSSDPVAIKKVVDRAKQLEGKIQEVKSFGVIIGEEGTEQFQGVLDELEVRSLILDLEKRTLTQEQEEILSQMKELVKEEKYSEAFELYLINQ